MPSRLWLILAFIVAFGATPAHAETAPARFAASGPPAPASLPGATPARSGAQE